ncbi:DnaJ domain-containing protein [Besnoitia besnoiti]|uniref:DnaJ domain-containing protein n=1 Tax=Besnoitia besnoiti TaxID=94643 RepID=A0A2A9MHI1_BESBE|nr:DnaJ domain-containing protein [Besnoitia besnoiti]PFH37998.1 DnaJ domain-containing protein [Besnoitia besnoiti]
MYTGTRHQEVGAAGEASLAENGAEADRGTGPRAFGIRQEGSNRAGVQIPGEMEAEEDIIPWRNADAELPPGIVADAFEVINHAPRRCMGCGAELQSEDPSRQGFVAAEKKEEWYSGRWKELPKAKGVEVDSVPDGVEIVTVKSPRFRKRTRLLLCRRCYRIQMYKQLDGEWEALANARDQLLPALAPETVINSVVKKMKRDSVVLKVVDVCDLESSVVPELFQACRAKRLHVIWLINRIDCLPRTANKREIKEWVRRMVRQIQNVHIDDCLLISSATGEGFEDLERRLETLLLPSPGGASAIEGRQIYVVGRVNAGKSTFVTRFLKFINYKHAGTIFMKRASGGVTRSALPGTTLSFLPFGLPRGYKLVDTPGIPCSHQVTSLLPFAADLYSIVPSKRLQPITYPLTEGKSLLIGAMARIDLSQGSTALVTCYFSHKITLHICKTVKAADLLSRKACTFLYPPHLPAGFDKLQPLVRHSVKVYAGNSMAYDDISIAGLGWISIAGAPGPKELHVWVPKGVKVFRRPAMLPLQLRVTGVEEFHGKSPRARGPRINAKKKKMVEALRDQEKREKLHAELEAREREAAEARVRLVSPSALSGGQDDEDALLSTRGAPAPAETLKDEAQRTREGEAESVEENLNGSLRRSFLVAEGQKEEVERLLAEGTAGFDFSASFWRRQREEAAADSDDGLATPSEEVFSRAESGALRQRSPFALAQSVSQADGRAREGGKAENDAPLSRGDGGDALAEVFYADSCCDADDEEAGGELRVRNFREEIAGSVVDLRPPEESAKRFTGGLR